MKDEEYCCVCGHKLSSHLKEEGGWRCHSLATIDGYQCECFLRDDIVGEEGLSYYDAIERKRQREKELDMKKTDRKTIWEELIGW